MASMPLPAPQRLIVAADFKPDSTGRKGVRKNVMNLAYSLRYTGVIIKVNFALRAAGYDLIDDIHAYGLKVFADLKANDIGETLENDGLLLAEAKPEIVTVMCTSGITGMCRFRAALPETEILGVTVLTTLTDADSNAMFCCTTAEGVMKFSEMAKDAGLDGLISSPAEAEALRVKFGLLMSLNTPGIRPLFAKVKGDDQNPDRVMTPTKAIKAKADRIVVGRPIVEATNPRDATLRILEEIEAATV